MWSLVWWVAVVQNGSKIYFTVLLWDSVMLERKVHSIAATFGAEFWILCVYRFLSLFHWCNFPDITGLHMNEKSRYWERIKDSADKGILVVFNRLQLLKHTFCKGILSLKHSFHPGPHFLITPPILAKHGFSIRRTQYFSLWKLRKLPPVSPALALYMQLKQ